MIIKEADDKSRDIAVLQSLLDHPSANAEVRKRIDQEIRNIRAGARGEQEAAYEMKVHYGASLSWALIHDLRVEHEGLVAQLDHLAINRWLDIWVCESKHFAEGVSINEHGEFTAFFAGKAYGVPSPIEQNSKHIRILDRLFRSSRLAFPKRLGITLMPVLRGLVLVSKNARISRPTGKINGIESVIKNDQFFTTVDKAIDENGILSMSRVVSAETLESVARQIASMHQPANFDWAARFGLTKVTPSAPPPIAIPATPTAETPVPDRPLDQSAASTLLAAESDPQKKSKQKLICHACGQAVAYNVAKFCWNNKPKFGGQIYCFACQKAV